MDVLDVLIVFFSAANEGSESSKSVKLDHKTSRSCPHFTTERKSVHSEIVLEDDADQMRGLLRYECITKKIKPEEWVALQVTSRISSR